MSDLPLPDGLQTRPWPMRFPTAAVTASSTPCVRGVGRQPVSLPRRKSHGDAVLFLLVFGLTFCVAGTVLMRSPAAPPEPPPSGVIEDFAYWLKHTEGRDGIATDKLALRYDGPAELHGCNVEVRLRYDDKELLVVGRLWSVWEPGEIKMVPLGPRSGSIQYIELSGTAQVDGREVRIAQTWEVRAAAD